jgi:hypothetical protein
MSEYQFVHFLALDRLLDDRQLEYMERQSTRATISRNEFHNEYHFGDFHGNVLEMLRRGFDVHLHYANFGIRRLMFRLPQGLPVDKKLFKKYCKVCGLTWHADRKGAGGILEIQPEADAGTFENVVFNVGELLPEIAAVREMLIAGDLRPLYVAWLACACDDEASEPPVPAGLADLPPAIIALADLYEIDEDLLRTAALLSPALPKSENREQRVQRWLDKQSIGSMRELLQRFLLHDAAAAHAETLAQLREESETAAWPVAETTRKLGKLRGAAREFRSQRMLRETRASEAARQQHLAKIAADPKRAIARIQSLVKQPSVKNYHEAARQLDELREALGPEVGPGHTAAVAEQLRHDYPHRRVLVSALRKHGFLANKTRK